ncbi:MAG: putative secreted protein [Microbacteriaceae bacterium]|jgi:hypothetical protein|nr:putative secreted protein [Microbacteriaceae bacterium]
MSTSPLRSARPLALALLLAVSPVLVGCSAAENIVGGVVDEAKSQAADALGDAVSDALGGAGISTDGELPPGFPAAAVPLVGTVQGGGAGPDASGWVVRTRLAAGESFATAQAALEAAGFASSAVNADADSGFGSFALAPYTVALTVAADSGGIATATYIVTIA